MRKLIAAIAQFLLFLVLDVVGSMVYHPFKLRTILASDPREPRIFLWDGLICMATGYLLIIMIAALRRKLNATAPWTTVALVLAGLAGYFLKLGFVTQNW